MRRNQFFILAAAMMLVACQSISDRGTIAELRHVQIEIEEEQIEGGLEKAMLSYQRFLEETPDSPLAPEAIRRLADLKIEKEYGTLTEGAGQKTTKGLTAPPQAPRIKNSLDVKTTGRQDSQPDQAEEYITPPMESERQPSKNSPAGVAGEMPVETVEMADELEREGALEAITLYTKLLNEYPLYKHNDQVLYQMSRAYEELGRIPEAMEIMDRMVRQFPDSRYIDEVQFRRAEYFFTHRKYLDAEDAYSSIVTIGVGSSYYELALYKLGWTFYKQELYEEALHRFTALLDYKVSVGYDFSQTEDETEHKRTDDTFRVISLSFSNIGGADSVVEYFSRLGKRTYENHVYSNLAEFYFDKRRYADASATYEAFVSRNPFHEQAPNFQMRVIEIHTAGGFPSLVLEGKKAFATAYGLKGPYWKFFDPDSRPKVLGFLKTNLKDLASHYHSCYQDPKQAEDKPSNYKEAHHWYRQFLASFPEDAEAPAINYHLADLLLEHRSFGLAAVEYEKTAYGYEPHENAAKAGYAAVYAYREHLAAVGPEDKDTVQQEVVRSSLKFADAYPEHEKAAVVLGAAADDLYVLKRFEEALSAANRLLEIFPDTDVDVVRAAWLVVGHSSYELLLYGEAETAYTKVLSLLPHDDKSREDLLDNLAASIYKQGEQANAAQDYRAAANHFLRVGRMAPTSKIRANAEYDGAVALIQLKDWENSAVVLVGFRNAFPGHELQPEVTKKIAYVYKENGQLSLAAGEYERMEAESKDDEIRREALEVAADLYTKDGADTKALAVYRRYVGYFPEPIALNLEMRNKAAVILKAQNNQEAYMEELEQIIAIDAAAGVARTDRTRYLAGNAALVLAENTYETFLAVKLVKPLEENMQKKNGLMKKAINGFNSLIEYESGELTAAATYYLAEIYAHFSRALMTSERPELTFDIYVVQPGDNLSTIAKRSHSDAKRIAHENNLTKTNLIRAGKKLKIPRGLYPDELEQYELALEEQSYPFEEKAISVHENNLELISRGVYNAWIDKSLQKLAKLVPARYDKPEEESSIIASLETYTWEIDRPVIVEQSTPEADVAVVDPSATVATPMQATAPAVGNDADVPAPPDTTGAETDLQAGQEAMVQEVDSDVKDNHTVLATDEASGSEVAPQEKQSVESPKAIPTSEDGSEMITSADTTGVETDPKSEQATMFQEVNPAEKVNHSVPATDEAIGSEVNPQEEQSVQISKVISSAEDKTKMVTPDDTEDSDTGPQTVQEAMLSEVDPPANAEFNPSDAPVETIASTDETAEHPEMEKGTGQPDKPVR